MTASWIARRPAFARHSHARRCRARTCAHADVARAPVRPAWRDTALARAWPCVSAWRAATTPLPGQEPPVKDPDPFAPPAPMEDPGTPPLPRRDPGEEAPVRDPEPRP